MTRRARQRMRLLCGALVVSGLLGSALPGGGAAWAQKPQRANRVLTVSEVTIVGRIQKPIAAVDVSRIPARLTMNRHDQKLLPKIQRALYRAPF